MVNFFLLAFSTLVSALQMEGYANEKYYHLSPTEFFALPEAQQFINPDSINEPLLEAAIFFASNEVRQKKRKSTFQFSSILQQSSRFHARYLLHSGKLDHINHKEKQYKTPMMRIDAFGGGFNASAENLALLSLIDLGSDETYFTNDQGEIVDKQNKPFPLHTYASLARKVVDGWMHSKGHRENLMGNYNFLGCGVSFAGNTHDNIPEIYLVQNFGKQ